MEASFERADAVYKCCNDHKITIEAVNHVLAHRLVSQIRALENKIAEHALEQYWTSLLRPLRRYRYNIATVPLPFNHPLIIPDNLLNVIADVVATCKRVYPAYAEDVIVIRDTLEEICKCADAPLLDAARNYLTRDLRKSGAVVLRNSTNVEIRKMIGELTREFNFEVLLYSAVLSFDVFETLIYIGPLGWFPYSARTSPHCIDLIALKYKWLSDGAPLTPSFITTDSAASVFPFRTSRSLLQTMQPMEFELSPEEAAPRANWAELGAEIARQSELADSDEKGLGRLLLLNGSIAIIVDASPGAKVHIIQSSGSTRLMRISAEGLEAGMFILVRTSRGGDLVVEIADTILGDQALPARQLQEKWKHCLIARVKARGEDAVLADLAGMGCARASSLNLRNWMGGRSIRPEFDDDFLSILILCDLGNEEAFFTNANLVVRAHRIAGFQIRQMLLSMVNQADLTEMIREGVMEFQLPGSRGGSLTAYRIQELAPNSISVPLNQIGHTYGVEFANG